MPPWLRLAFLLARRARSWMEHTDPGAVRLLARGGALTGGAAPQAENLAFFSALLVKCATMIGVRDG